MTTARDNWNDKIVCYYTNWSQYRWVNGTQFFPENLNATLCTHLMFAFAKVAEIDNDEWGLNYTEAGFQLCPSSQKSF